MNDRKNIINTVIISVSMIIASIIIAVPIYLNIDNNDNSNAKTQETKIYMNLEEAADYVGIPAQKLKYMAEDNSGYHIPRIYLKNTNEYIFSKYTLDEYFMNRRIDLGY